MNPKGSEKRSGSSTEASSFFGLLTVSRRGCLLSVNLGRKPAMFSSQSVYDLKPLQLCVWGHQENHRRLLHFPRCRMHHFVPRLTQAQVLSTMSVNGAAKTRHVNCPEEELRGLRAGVHRASPDSVLPAGAFPPQEHRLWLKRPTPLFGSTFKLNPRARTALSGPLSWVTKL